MVLCQKGINAWVLGVVLGVGLPVWGASPVGRAPGKDQGPPPVLQPMAPLPVAAPPPPKEPTVHPDILRPWEAAHPLDTMVPLLNLDQVAAMCREVQGGAPADGQPGPQSRKEALQRMYAVLLTGDRFTLGEYDADQGHLPLNASRGFHLMRGGLSIWSPESEPLIFEVPLPLMQRVEQVRDQGTLGVTLYFHVDADPDGADDGQDGAAPCLTRTGTQVHQLMVAYLAGQLVDVTAGKVLSQFVTEKGLQTPALAHRFLGDALMRLGAPEGAGQGAAAVVTAVEQHRAGFGQCYELHGRHAEGGMVLGLDINKKGALTGASIDVASLESESLGECLLAEMKQGKFLAKGAQGHVMIPLVWSRD